MSLIDFHSQKNFVQILGKEKLEKFIEGLLGIFHPFKLLKMIMDLFILDVLCLVLSSPPIL